MLVYAVTVDVPRGDRALGLAYRLMLQAVAVSWPVDASTSDPAIVGRGPLLQEAFGEDGFLGDDGQGCTPGGRVRRARPVPAEIFGSPPSQRTPGVDGAFPAGFGQDADVEGVAVGGVQPGLAHALPGPVGHVASPDNGVTVGGRPLAGFDWTTLLHAAVGLERSLPGTAAQAWPPAGKDTVAVAALSVAGSALLGQAAFGLEGPLGPDGQRVAPAGSAACTWARLDAG
jgi:hypothetical protein